MAVLSPRFAFLAALCALSVLSSAPISDAAVLRLRASDSASTDMASANTHAGATTWFRGRSSHVVDDPPVLPPPKGLGASRKNSSDSDDSPSSLDVERNRTIVSSGSHGEKNMSEGDENENSPYDDEDAISKKGGKAKSKHRRWDPFSRIKQLSESWFGDNHVHYARAPHHRHHHHHHDHYHRGLRTGRSKPEYDRYLSASANSVDDERVVHPRTPHHHHHKQHEKVVVSGDHDHVHLGRSPHHHHHHHHPHHGEYEKVVVSGDHDHVRVDRSPRSPHHHSGHGKVIISGNHDHVHVDRSPDWRHGFADEKAIIPSDNDNVHHQRSVLIAGEQGQSYVVPRVAKRIAEQELFTIPALGKRADDVDCVPGHIDIVSPSDDLSSGTRIASLILSSSDATMSDNSATPPSAFVLNASGMSATQMCLLASSSNSSNSTLSPTEIGVTLRVAMFNVSAASITPYCATFDPDPPAPAPLKAEECTDDPVSKSMSQLFAFDRATGVVRPLWFSVNQDDGNGSENNGCTGDVDDAVPQTASLSSVTEVDDSDSASTPSVDWSSTSNNTVSTADPSQVAPSNSSEGNISVAQNVALVFVSTNPEVLDTPADASANISSIPATTTGVEASNNALSTATGSSTSAIASSTSGSLNTITSPIVQTAVSSVTPSPIPSLAALASGANSTSSMVLGVQVVPESASNAASTSASASPIMTPVNTQPYEWMFTLDPR